MSLQYLGISHFPMLHRQFSSPTSTISLESSPNPNQDLTQDNKDVLIDRLNDLVLRISKDGSVEDGIVSAIHTGVDRIELLLKDTDKRAYKTSPMAGNDTFGPLTPTQNARMRFPESPSSRHSFTREGSSAYSEFNGREQLSGSPPSHRRSITYAATMGTERVVKIAKSAEELALKLSATVAELQVRREESDHVHDLLINRAQRAAERILVLEYRVKEMTEDFDASQSELKFLRIQLQSIEAQCAQYIPKDHDQELAESIMNWKIDWEDIDRRSRARRKNFHLPNGVLDSPRTVNKT